MDEKELKLPSGRLAVIRTYTTRKDDKIAEAILKDGMKATASGGTEVVEFSPAAIMESQEKYVELLTVSIDGNKENIPALLEELRSADYQAIADAVAEITNPKGSSKS